MMHMTFYWGIKVTLLFDFWKTETWTDYSLTLIACVLFSAFYQYLEHRRFQLNKMSSNTTVPNVVSTSSATTYNPNSIEAPLIVANYSNKLAALRICCPGSFAGAIMFGVNSAIGYMLMLAVMSFNGGVFAAVIVGLSAGQLLFRSSPNEDVLVVDNPCACA